MSSLDLFARDKPIIGMIHLMPLPGSPKFSGDIEFIVARAEYEAQTLYEAGVDGLIVENYNDAPFSLDQPPAEHLALMASILTIVRRKVTVPIGVNVHFNAWRAEIALAYACKAQFTRVEVFVDTVVTASGIVEPCASAVTRYRRDIGASAIALFADLHPKFTRNLLPTTLVESAKMAKRAMADALIVTGEATGVATPVEDIQVVRETVDLPVLAGSGTSVDNVQAVLRVADGAIIGSAFKEGGIVQNRVSADAVKALLQAART